MPASALQSGSAGSFVFLLKPGAPPKVAASDDDASPNSGDAPAGARAGGKAKGPKPTDGADPDAPKTPPYYVDVQPVVVDVTEGTQIILKSGLKAGDQVIVDGQEKLKKYSKVIPATARTGGRGGGANSAGSVEPVDTPGKRVGRPGGNAANDKAVTADEAASHPHHQKPGSPQ
jgi:multidrug efflux system membrane fusion protein